MKLCEVKMTLLGKTILAPQMGQGIVQKTVPGRRVSLWEEGTIPSLKRIFFVPSFRKKISGLHNLFRENNDDMNMEYGFPWIGHGSI